MRQRFTPRTVATKAGLRKAIAAVRREHCAMTIDGSVDAAIGKCVEWGYKPWDEIERCDKHDECWTVPGAD